MSEVTRILEAIQQGDARAADELLPLVYEELRGLAARRMANEAPGQTLQPTALVHEAWLRLTGAPPRQGWENRAHFFSAAAEAMRRILIENARRKSRIKHGGAHRRVDLEEADVPAHRDEEQLLRVSEAIDALAVHDPVEARIVKLRFFIGLSHDEVAQTLGLSEKTVRRYWIHAKAWLYDHIQKQR